MWCYNKDLGLYKCVRPDQKGSENFKNPAVKGANAWRKITDFFKQTGRWQTEAEIDNEMSAGKGSKDYQGGKSDYSSKNDYSGSKNNYNKNTGKNSDQWQQSGSGDGCWQQDPWAQQQQAWGLQQEWGKGWKQ